MRPLSIAWGIVATVLLAGCASTGTTPSAAPSPTPESVTPAAALPGAPLALAVYKHKREMVLLKDGEAQETFPIRLGTNSYGHKVRQGDHRTPEGQYAVCKVKPSRFKSFLWLSYPNLEDARRALEEGRLSSPEFQRIARAVDAGACPPANTPLGGLVGIHGDYEEPPRSYDWTEGCIALTRNEDLLRLASVVRPGTPVVIYP